MGGCWGSGSYVSSDWKEGIKCVQKEAEHYYGIQDGYSGAPNSCSFTYLGDFVKKTSKELDSFIQSCMDKMGNGDGGVVRMGIQSYNIYSTCIEECECLPFDSKYVLKQLRKGPAALVSNKYNIGVNILKEGNITELKKYAHIILRDNKYAEKIYIVGRNKSYLCTYNLKEVKKTQRKTDDKYLVLPVYKFIYFGWFRE